MNHHQNTSMLKRGSTELLLLLFFGGVSRGKERDNFFHRDYVYVCDGRSVLYRMFHNHNITRSRFTPEFSTTN
jgi:hypothetical protein